MCLASLGLILESLASDSKISPKEAKHIRQEWEKLKRAAEGYVKCCEEGNFKQLNRDLKK